MNENTTKEIVIRVFRDGEAWCAVGPGFVNIQESACGFGSTPGIALIELIGHDPDLFKAEAHYLRAIREAMQEFEGMRVHRSMRRLSAEQADALKIIVSALYGLQDAPITVPADEEDES